MHTATINYRIKYRIEHAVEELNSLTYIDANRHYKHVENYEARRREIWKTLACPSNRHWQPRPDFMPMKHIGGPKDGEPIIPPGIEELQLPAFIKHTQPLCN